MIIRRLRAQRFGCLDDRTVAFGPGLNIVFGPNESGKSTLHRAILMALLDRPARRKANEDYRQWGAARLFQFEVEFETADGRCWSLAKDYQANRARLLGPGGDTASWEEIQRILSGALGSASAELLQSTCCIAQDELAAISDGRKELSQSLESMVTGGDDDITTAGAIADLQKAIQGLRRGLGVRGAANPGRLAVLAQRTAELEAQAASHRAVLEQEDQTRQRLGENHDRLAQLEIELQPRLTARQAADQAFALRAQLTAAQESEATLIASLERIDAALAARDAAAAALADPGNSLLPEEEYRGLTRLHERVALLRSQAAEMLASPASAGMASQTPSWTWQTVAASAGGPALLALLSTSMGIAAALYGAQARLPAPAVAVLVGLSIFLDTLAALWLSKTARRPRGPLAGHGETQAADYNAGRLVLQAHLEKESQELAARFEGLGCTDWVALERRQDRARSMRAQQEESQARLEGLLPSGRTRNDLEETRKATSLRRRDLEETLAEPAWRRALQMGPVEYQALCQEIAHMLEERQSLERESIGLQARLDASRAASEDLIALEEQLEAASAELLHLQETLAVYELARDTLQVARERTLVRAQDELAPRAGAYLASLTGGRYSSMIVDSSLNVSVAPPGGLQAAVEPRRLSKGTQDQVYLAVRLALMDLLFPNARPPLFLDDPFVKFDDARRTAALQLCQRIAQERQVILFTCSSDYTRWGRVIAMSAPTAGTSPDRSPGSRSRYRHDFLWVAVGSHRKPSAAISGASTHFDGRLPPQPSAAARQASTQVTRLAPCT